MNRSFLSQATRPRFSHWLLFLLLVLGAGATLRAQAPAPQAVEYRGGRWFDETRFVARTMYVVDGTFRARRPARVDSVVDLAGGHVVPPFADAHQHLVDPRIDNTIRAYLRDGIYYVRDQGNAPIGRQPFHALLNRPTTFDYVSANQGWTSPGGHPVEVVLRAAQPGTPMGTMLRERMTPDFVMQVDTVADVERLWPYFLAGLPVSAHVFTAADFRAAVAAGVDWIAHLPGGRGTAAQFLLTDADARLARRRGVTVATTVTQHGDQALTDQLIRDQYTHNIRLLRRHGVPLLLGSDKFGETAVVEAEALARSGLFSNLELLRMWSVTTPRAIFPNRRIGRLRDGYEASFLVLGGDPLADFANTRRILRRVKQGVPIELAG